jgi:hypothetical protein
MPEREELQTLESFVEAQLFRSSVPTSSIIRELIFKTRTHPLCAVSDEEAEQLARRLEQNHSVNMEFGSVLKEAGYQPWLEGELASLDFYYWNRYRKLLEAKHFPLKVINTLHRETERTLGLLENPRRSGPWSRRGMVVGHVQSGKTANYTGLICKAADAGYRLIVIIAGVHNNLRNQTQRRIDEGFIGRDSARLLSKKGDLFIGVGKINGARRPATFTNSVRDFNKVIATSAGIPLQNLNEPAVLVIKKYPKTLENLLEWLRQHNAARGATTVDVPMLLIDDEADNASINVAYGKGAISTINGHIRDLLKMFSRSCYVGYTATPFANIFIDPDTDDQMRGQDLFPRHFIVSLEPPSNYFGASKVFRDDSDLHVRHITNWETTLPTGHKADYRVHSLPDSMIEAVRVFLIARALRILRGQGTQHSSMLINASRFTNVQSQIRDLVEDFTERVVQGVRTFSGLAVKQALKDPEIAALKKLWQQEFANAGHTWAEVQATLLDAVAPVKVVEVNNRSHGTLAYDDYEATGLHVIAVGGYSLSRGLTLEGLTVSYFLRNSKMYDTLMQMGRWFGYRPDYQDLCRVWMPEEAEGWYAHVSDATDELREELRQMAEANATPEEFGLKVRAHPTALEVTARNKLGSGERVAVRIGLKNRFIETTPLQTDKFTRNREVVRELVRRLAADDRLVSADKLIRGNLLVRDVSVDAVLTFVTQFQNHPLSTLTDPRPAGAYIRAGRQFELARWDVLFAGLASDNDLTGDDLGVPIRCQQRTVGLKSRDLTAYITNKQRVASRGVERFGLDEEAARAVELAFEASNAPNSKGQWNYPDRIYRPIRPRPLLIVHLLDLHAKDLPDSESTHRLDPEPVVAYSISFPDTERHEDTVEYVVTTQWMRENLLGDDEQELEEEEQETVNA